MKRKYWIGRKVNAATERTEKKKKQAYKKRKERNNHWKKRKKNIRRAMLKNVIKICQNENHKRSAKERRKRREF